MSVRQGFLALLSERPMHGYQLRQEFERRTGGTWPLNIGQAYSTLSRLERDGLIEPDQTLPDGGDAPLAYRLTDTGRTQAAAWWDTPVDRGAPTRDELAIKLALAVTVQADGHAVDVARMVQRQRTATMTVLQDYTRLKREASDDLAWSLVLDSLVFATEAELRWLDHVEASVLRATPSRTAPQAPAPADAETAGSTGGAEPKQAVR